MTSVFFSIIYFVVENINGNVNMNPIVIIANSIIIDIDTALSGLQRCFDTKMAIAVPPQKKAMVNITIATNSFKSVTLSDLLKLFLKEFVFSNVYVLLISHDSARVSHITISTKASNIQ